MGIEKIFSFLVPPLGDEDDFSKIKGAEVPLEGKLFKLQNTIYQESPESCRVAINFVSTGEDHEQKNEVRTEIINFALDPTEETSFLIAKRLARATTNRSKLGLIFIVKGNEGGKIRTVISRFPADSAILADDSDGNLNIEFLERVFMKSSRSFKAVMYESNNPETRYWEGKAIDKQVSSSDTEIRAYWVQEFLQSTYLTTSAEGTRRLGAALRNAIQRTEDSEIKDEIVAAVKLARNLGGKALTGEELFERFCLSEKAINTITDCLVDKKVLKETFEFNLTEFMKQVPLRTIRLSNGATMSAPSENFDEVFDTEVVEGKRGVEVKISTKGKLVNQSLSK